MSKEKRYAEKSLKRDLTIRDLAMAAASGILLSLAFPRPELFLLAWVAIVPLLLTVKGKRAIPAAFLGFVAGLFFYGALLYWVMDFGKLPWILLSAHQSLFFALFAASIALFNAKPLQQAVFAASAWTALEWLRSLGFGGFTWGSLAVSQYRNIPFLQLASITGAWGLSFLIAFFNSSCAELLARKDWKPLAVALAAISAVGIGGVFAIKPIDLKKPILVAIVQGCQPMRENLSEEEAKGVVLIYIKKTLQAAKFFNPDLVLWPETVIPVDFVSTPWPKRSVSLLARVARCEMIVGATAREKSGSQEKLYNGAFLFDKSGKLKGKYYKVHLVPFGEKVPFRKWLPFLKRYRVRSEDYASGRGYQPIGRYGVMICFESVFPYISRELVNNGAAVLAVLTNDGWFGRTAAPRQHLAFSVLRAVENRRWLLRAASTGISCSISPNGEIIAELPSWESGFLPTVAVFSSKKTIYTRYGDWLAVMSFLYCLGALLTQNRFFRHR